MQENSLCEVDIKKVQEELCSLISQFEPIHWKRILEFEPEYKAFASQVQRYPLGPFLVLLTMVGLNSYQLKGRAEDGYWPSIGACIAAAEVPDDPLQLQYVLENFYRCERLPKGKLKRLDKFLGSDLAGWLWGVDEETIRREFGWFWKKLGLFMQQRQDAKTIVFAMKCLAMGLYMHKGSCCWDEKIAIPVDSRITAFTEELLSVSDLEKKKIQEFWFGVAEEMQTKSIPVCMIHIGSLVWQIAGLKKQSRYQYLERIGAEECIQLSQFKKHFC